MLLANIFESAGNLSYIDRRITEISTSSEHDPTEVLRILGRMKRRMQQHSYLALKDCIDELEDLGIHDNVIAEAISTARIEILNWFDSQLSAAFEKGSGGGTTPYLINQMLLLVDLGIVWPEISRLLERHKNDVVRSLLQYLQQSPDNNIVLMHIRGYIERFTRLGIRWAELRVIWNSIMDELKRRNLDEDSSEERPDWYAGFVDYLGDTNITAAVYTAKAAGVNMHNSELLAAHVNDWKWYLLRYFERCLGLSFQGFEEIHKEIKLLKSIGVDWPELDTYWDDNKEKVMRQLLMTLKMEDEDAGFYTWQEINALRQAGVRWPELDIVMKGAMDMMGRKENLEEHDRDDSYADAEDARYAAIEASFTNEIGEFSTDLSDLGDLIYGLEAHGARERDIENLIKDNLAALTEWFKKNVDSNSPDSIADFLHCLDRAGVFDDSNASKIIYDHLEHRKDEIVAWILTSIRQMRPETGISKIFASVFKWPELDIINRSIDADRSRGIRESEDDEKAKLRDEGRQMIIDLMRKQEASGKRGIYYAMYYIEEWGLHLKDWPELRGMIDEHKHQIIYDMLKSFKDSTEIDLAEESARFAIARMKKIGVDWPELDMIERSIRKNTDRQIQEEDDEELSRDSKAKAEFRLLLKDLDHDIKNESWDLVAFDLIDIGMTEVKDVIPDRLKEMIEANKHGIMRGMLERIKVSRYTEMTMHAITALHNIGINWPELMIMHKSLTTGRKD